LILAMNVRRIILASTSPRRRQLVKSMFEGKLFVEFIGVNIKESLHQDISSDEAAMVLARKKLDSVYDEYGTLFKDDIIVTADTVVVNGGQIMGKPSDEKEAFVFLKDLSGKEHKVISAFCIGYQNKCLCKQDTTKVKFFKLDNEEIKFYINKYKPFDKAGAYGIQEWIGLVGIEKIEGSFYTVMGLPTHLLYYTVKDILRK